MIFSLVTFYHGLDEILCHPKTVKMMMMIYDREERNDDDEVGNDDDDDNVRCSHSLLRHPVVHCQNNPKTRQLFLQQNSQEHTLLM